jgi:hypothetical protein
MIHPVTDRLVSPDAVRRAVGGGRSDLDEEVEELPIYNGNVA